jgi:uncharacterized protein (DUF2267 family)
MDQARRIPPKIDPDQEPKPRVGADFGQHPLLEPLMSAKELPVFDKTLQETNHWLKLMMGELGIGNRSAAFAALRASLHALRDRVGVENAAHLGAQMPMLLRGAFYEGWRPSSTPTRERHLDDFINHVQAELPADSPLNPAEAARACFCVMGRCLDPGEMTKLRGILPHEVLNLWPYLAPRA